MLRHYEIVFLVHPDQSAEVPAMVERYQSTVKNSGGVIHRYEDWGRRKTASPIKKTGLRKAHYLLMNVEASPDIIAELKNTFAYNDVILRSLFLRKKSAITEPSNMMKAIEQAKQQNRDSVSVQSHQE